MILGIRESNQKIVTDGLIVHLDAAQLLSYASGSSTWFDLSGNNNSSSLVNTPSFSSDNGGAISFDGTNDHATRLINLSSYDQITVEVWIKPNNANDRMIFEHSANWNSNTGGFGLYINSDGGVVNTGMCHTNHQSGAGGKNYAFTCGTNYSCHVNIFSKINDSTGRLTYVNGNLLSFSGPYSTSTATTFNANAFQNHIMYLASRGGASSFYNGNIPIFRIYSRKLSASEVLQNYNATKTRFGL